MKKQTVLTLPGWMGSGADHWQTHWERSNGALRVEQDDWIAPAPQAWIARLEARVEELGGEVALAAHSLGCHLITRWALSSRLVDRVRFALLVAPPDLERADSPAALRAWTPLVGARLPFPSIVVHSADDPYCSPARAMALAAQWGSATHDVGARGHINSESALGAWPEGHALLSSGL
jgi:uncharacterized protein